MTQSDDPVARSREDATPHHRAHDVGCTRADPPRGPFFEHLRTTIYSVAYRILGDTDEADAVTSEVLSQAKRYANPHDGETRHSPWLVVLARSRASDRLRGRDRTVGRPTAQPVAPHRPQPASSPHDGEPLAHLTAGERSALALAYWKGLPHHAIAEQLGEPVASVKALLRSALRKLSTTDGSGPPDE